MVLFNIWFFNSKLWASITSFLCFGTGVGLENTFCIIHVLDAFVYKSLNVNVTAFEWFWNRIVKNVFILESGFCSVFCASEDI